MAKDLRINERIRVREVLVIDDEGQKLGTIPIHEALAMARDQGLDLVEVAPNANPPVCRVLDYGKFKYEQAKKERDAHKHQRQVQVREVRFKSKIGAHDLDFKTKVIGKLLAGGDKVKVSVLFRGREITHPEIGRELLQRVQAKLKDAGNGNVEKHISMEGRFMTMIVAPTAPKAPPKPKVPRAPRTATAGAPADGAMAAALTQAGVVAAEAPAEPAAPPATEADDDAAVAAAAAAVPLAGEADDVDDASIDDAPVDDTSIDEAPVAAADAVEAGS